MAFCVITVFVSTREIARIPPRHPPSLLRRWANLRRSEKTPQKKQKPHCIFPQVSVANNSDVRFPKGIWLERRIGKPRFLRENTSWWKYDVSAGCRRDASWTCGEGQIAFVPLLIKSPVIMVPQDVGGGGEWTKSDSGVVLIYTNVDSIYHIFPRAKGLWGDCVMTMVMAAIWSEGFFGCFFFSASFTKLRCEAR